MNRVLISLMIFMLLIPVVAVFSLPSEDWRKGMSIYERNDGEVTYLNSFGSSVTSDEEGNGYVAGAFVHLVGNSEEVLSFLAKYDKGGNIVWINYWPGRFVGGFPGYVDSGGVDLLAKALDIDYRDGYVYVAGCFDRETSEDPLPGYIAKVRADDGRIVWFYLFHFTGLHGYDSYVNPYSIDVVEEGGNTRIYVAGAIRYYMDWGGVQSTVYGGFLAKFTDGGAAPSLTWARALVLNDLTPVEFRSARVQGGRVYAGGVTPGEDGSLNSKSDAVMSAFSTSGDLLWAKIWGGDSMDIVYSVVPMGASVYGIGQTDSFVEYPGMQGLVLKYDLSGNFLAGVRIDTDNQTSFSHVTPVLGDLLITGISMDSGNGGLSNVRTLIVGMSPDLGVKWSVLWEDFPLMMKWPYASSFGNGSIYVGGSLVVYTDELTEERGLVPVDLHSWEVPDLSSGGFFSVDLTDRMRFVPAGDVSLGYQLGIENLDFNDANFMIDNKLFFGAFLMKMHWGEVTLKVRVEPAEGGIISPPAGSYTLPRGAVIRLNATPSDGYELHWIVDGRDAGSNQSIEVLMDSDHTVQAVFSPVKRERIAPPSPNQLAFMDFPQGFRYIASESDFRFNRDLLNQFLGPAVLGQRSKVVILGGPYIYRFVWRELGVEFLKEDGSYRSMRIPSGQLLTSSYGHEDYGAIYVDSAHSIVRVAGITRYGTRAALYYLLNNKDILNADGLRIVRWVDLNGNREVDGWEIELFWP